MSEAWRHHLILLRTPGVGPITWRRLLGQFNTPEAVIHADAAHLREIGLSTAAIEWLRQPNHAVIDRDLAWLEADGHHLVSLEDADYPPILAGINDAPPLLFVIGDLSLLSQPQLAIVGSRSPSPNGRENAHLLARELASAGLVITSGLAVGIDAAAHEGALETGRTIAVTGTGPDRIYPAVNRELAYRIAAQGTLVTEFPPGTPVRRENFPQRNRIMSGLCLGTLVVEAGAESGSLITARIATEQGREVFAVPGSIRNPLSRGCHALIRQGAKLVETAQDIIEELGSLLGGLAMESTTPTVFNTPTTLPILDHEYQRLLNLFGHDPIAPDVLIQRSGLGAAEISSMLLFLELDGYVAALPGGRYGRTAKIPCPENAH